MNRSVLENSEMVCGCVSEYFRGKSVFLTGGTGFMGKVIIEKLLRSCPDVENIYLLVREKRKSDPYSRIKEMTNLPLFDVLKEKCPKNLQKLKPMTGDVRELGLGLCEKDRTILEETVSIIYHAAASVRFYDSFESATIMNVRGTLEVVKLAMRMKKLEVLVHISTTYCNLHESIIEEKMYPAPADWREMIRMAEERDDLTLRILTHKILGGYPNTYTFTKGLAEHVINDHSNKIPSIIIRPSILISTAHDPFPGWIDNFNGPVGLFVAAGLGLTHLIYADGSCVADYMPVDLAVNTTIIATVKKGIKSASKELSVYQCSNGKFHQITFMETLEIGSNCVQEYSIGYCIWHPCIVITKSRLIYFIGVMIFHIVPAIFLDLILKITGKKPILLKVARRIYIANNALSHFTLNEWKFENKRARDLEREICGSDLKMFGYSLAEVDTERFLSNAARGIRKYLLKRNNDSFEKETQQRRWMYVLHLVTKTTAIFLLLWYIYNLFEAYQY